MQADHRMTVTLDPTLSSTVFVIAVICMFTAWALVALRINFGKLPLLAKPRADVANWSSYQCKVLLKSFLQEVFQLQNWNDSEADVSQISRHSAWTAYHKSNVKLWPWRFSSAVLQPSSVWPTLTSSFIPFHHFRCRGNQTCASAPQAKSLL